MLREELFSSDNEMQKSDLYKVKKSSKKFLQDGYTMIKKGEV